MNKPSPIYHENRGDFLRKGKVVNQCCLQHFFLLLKHWTFKVGDSANYFSPELSAEWDDWAQQVYSKTKRTALLAP